MPSFGLLSFYVDTLLHTVLLERMAQCCFAKAMLRIKLFFFVLLKNEDAIKVFRKVYAKSSSKLSYQQLSGLNNNNRIRLPSPLPPSLNFRGLFKKSLNKETTTT